MKYSNAVKGLLLILAFPLGAWGGAAFCPNAISHPMPPVLERFQGLEDAMFRSSAAQGDVFLVEQTILQGAGVNRVHAWRNRTALHDAALEGHGEVIDVLLRHQAEIDVRDQFGYTPLALAAWIGHLEVAVRLLQGGADPHARENDGCSILYIAARRGHAVIVECLLGAGLDPQNGMVNGLTALHVAALNGHLNVVETLVYAGANLWVQDPIGRTAIDYAEQFGHPKVVAFLEEIINLQAMQALFNEEDIGERPELLDAAVDFDVGGCFGMPDWGSL